VTTIIELLRDSHVPGGRDKLSIGVDAWRLLYELGATFGWKPRGTTYVRIAMRGNAEPSKWHDYEAGDRRDQKCVDAEDATSWSSALIAARNSSHLPSLIASNAAEISGGGAVSDIEIESLNKILNEFIAYARGGAFTFSQTNHDAK
jgi:hypothetical protein